MTEYSKFNMVYRLQKWMDSVPGQTFLNYAYSWGASVVILGTLFKLTHLPGANFMLYLGMGTEVIVFFLSAFDRPFDKTADGMDLAIHSEEENEGEAATGGVQVQGGGTVIIGSGFVGGGAVESGNSGKTGISSVDTGGSGETGISGETIIGGGGVVGGGVVGGGVVGGGVVGGLAGSPVAQSANASWIQQQQELSPEMEEATTNYVAELNRLTEMLAKVSEQSARLTRDSEEMENLNRTLTGICKVYEMQLKGASAQIGTIDQINEQSRRMAEQIGELNKIYARMIEAMTANMVKS
ncbi:MAG: gliding motility protein GldL [Prevotella sp.]|nr:gliding motility protein GldL [Prevotella sp.]